VLWGQLTFDQQRFITAMLEVHSKKAAAEAIGLEPNTVYKWPVIVDEVLSLVATDLYQSAMDVLQLKVLKAVMVKVAGLDSGDEKIRQAVATEVIDRVFGKPTQKQEIGLTGTITTLTADDMAKAAQEAEQWEQDRFPTK